MWFINYFQKKDMIEDLVYKNILFIMGVMMITFLPLKMLFWSLYLVGRSFWWSDFMLGLSQPISLGSRFLFSVQLRQRCVSGTTQCSCSWFYRTLGRCKRHLANGANHAITDVMTDWPEVSTQSPFSQFGNWPIFFYLFSIPRSYLVFLS